MNIELLNKYKNIKREDSLYGEYVKKTAALINKSYIITFKLVEKWEPATMAQLYDESMTKYRNRGFDNPAMMWWVSRRKLLTGKD